MSKITNDGLTQPGTGCFMAVPIWRVKGLLIVNISLLKWVWPLMVVFWSTSDYCCCCHLLSSGQRAVDAVNAALMSGDHTATLRALNNPALCLPTAIQDTADRFYHEELCCMRLEKQVSSTRTDTLVSTSFCLPTGPGTQNERDWNVSVETVFLICATKTTWQSLR